MRYWVIWVIAFLWNTNQPFYTNAQEAEIDTSAFSNVAVTAFYGRAKWQAIPGSVALIR